VSGVGRDGCDTAQVGEGGFRAHPVGIVPGGGQELAGDLDAHARQGQQLWRGGGTSGVSSASSSRISLVSCW
jgi:hypothetical protein